MNDAVHRATGATSDWGVTQETGETAREFTRDAAKKLKALNGVTEKDFLSVGACLQRLSVKATATAEAARSIVELVTGTEVEKDTERLSEVMGLVDAYFGKCQAKFQHDFASLSDMLKVVDTAHRPLSVFRTIVKHLHMLGVSTRIENARLTNDGNFQVLAENVEKLSVVIASKSEGILKGLASLQKAVRETIAKVLSGEEATNERTREILDAVSSSLETLSEKRRLSSSTARRLAAKSEEVARDMSDIISSLQFHDITRQQIEHVIEVFEEVTGVDVIPELGEVGSLQIGQLDHARKEMLSAMARITDAHHRVSAHLSAMLQETETLIGVAGKEGSSFLSDLNHSVSFVIGAITKNAETDSELAGAVDYVSGLIENLSVFVNDIEEIAAEIELIALNAQVRAARTAGDGGALGVLAEAIRNLSDTTRTQTLTMTATLKEVNHAALELGTADEHKGNHAEIDAITTEMESLFNSLGASQEHLSSLLAELKRGTGEQTAAIATMVEGMSAHTRTDEVVGAVIRGLRQFVAPGKADAAPKAGSEALRLDKLTSRYTMHQERYVHEAHLGRASGTTQLVQAKSFTDNVELF